uniref:Uncharacterized protein n=1 Tax=Anguilla anguilla TaxID=7936 RepID=A0A0E9RVM3_ANGAN
MFRKEHSNHIFVLSHLKGLKGVHFRTDQVQAETGR